MPDCELTPAGLELANWYADILRDGGHAPRKYYLEDNGSYVLLGEGNHRVAYGQSHAADRGGEDPMFTSPDCVLKLAKFDDPWATRNEILNWEYMPDDIAQYYAPVHDYADDGMWLLMPEAEMGVTGEERDRVEDAIESKGYEIDDVRTDNMGYLDGDPVIIDYGFRIKTGVGEQIGPRSREYFEKTRKELELEERFS